MGPCVCVPATPQPCGIPGPGYWVLTGRASAPSAAPPPPAAASALPPGSAPEGEGEAAGAERLHCARVPRPLRLTS